MLEPGDDRGPGPDDLAGRLHVRPPGEGLLEEHPPLDPSEGRADAEVGTEAERHLGVGLAVDAEPVRVVGVLDWELATVGDPLMDVGSALAYWAQADDPEAIQAIRLQPTNAPGMWTRDQVWAAYGARRGLAVSESERRFYELFGTFRLAVIAQQIYYRFFHGQTTNPKAGMMGQFVRILDARCTELLP